MFSDLKDYHNTEGKRIVDELTAEEIQRRFTLIQPVFEKQIKEFTQEFYNLTRAHIEKFIAKKEIEIDQIIATNNYDINKIKQIYLNDKYIDSVTEDFEKAANIIYSDLYQKHQKLNAQKIKEALSQEQGVTEEMTEKMAQNFMAYLTNELHERPGSAPYTASLDIVAEPVTSFLM